MRYVLIFLIGLLIGLSLSYGGNNGHIYGYYCCCLQPNVYGLPLKDFYKFIVKKAGMDYAVLDSLIIIINENGSIERINVVLYGAKNGKPMRCQVHYWNGKLDYLNSKLEMSCSEVNEPIEGKSAEKLIDELQKLNFRSLPLKIGTAGMIIDVEKVGRGVKFCNGKIYLLKNGSLIRVNGLKTTDLTYRITFTRMDIIKVTPYGRSACGTDKILAFLPEDVKILKD